MIYGRNTTLAAHWILGVTPDFVAEDGREGGLGGIGEREVLWKNSDVWFVQECSSGGV